MNKETTAITLAGQQFAVSAPALGKLKKILSGMNRVSASNGDLDVIMTEAPLYDRFAHQQNAGGNG